MVSGAETGEQAYSQHDPVGNEGFEGDAHRAMQVLGTIQHFDP